jgi:hypothetical protein
VNTKTALVILVLVLLAMLLLIAVALGADRPGRPSGGIEGALESLKSDNFLRLEGDVSADCSSGPTAAVLVPGQECTITVPKRGLLSKPTRLVFRIADTSQVKLVLVPDRGPELDMTLKPGKCAEAAIGRGGGMVRLSECAGLGQCVVSILDRGCRDD